MTDLSRTIEIGAKTPEQIASEIVNGLHFSSNRVVNGRLVGEQCFAFEAIVAAIRAERTHLPPEGFVVVPREPTWAMQISGRDAILSEDDDLDLSTDDARAVYRAMIAASQGPNSASD